MGWPLRMFLEEGVYCGGFWENRYSAEPVLDDTALVQPAAIGACLHAPGPAGVA